MSDRVISLLPRRADNSYKIKVKIQESLHLECLLLCINHANSRTTEKKVVMMKIKYYDYYEKEDVELHNIRIKTMKGRHTRRLW
jgi:hypothetical protein